MSAPGGARGPGGPHGPGGPGDPGDPGGREGPGGPDERARVRAGFGGRDERAPGPSVGDERRDGPAAAEPAPTDRAALVPLPPLVGGEGGPPAYGSGAEGAEGIAGGGPGRAEPAPGTAPGPAATGDRATTGDGATTGEAADAGGRLTECVADLQRLKAEYDNYRKRVQRDRHSLQEVAVANVLRGLLPVLDAVAQARRHDEVTGGFRGVVDVLEEQLAALGLEEFGDPGEPFDPERHEALSHERSAEVERPVCVRVLRRGYRVGGHLLRPAEVAVAEPE